MNCSLRIKSIVDMAETAEVLLDVGCDHGYTCICAVKEKKSKKAIAADIRPGPLAKASENIASEGLSDVIRTVLSDGLSDITEPFDVCVISGMGGLLIASILSAFPDKLSGVKQMLLSPHSETSQLRKYLIEKTDFGIKRERVLRDNGKFYTILDVRRKEETENHYSEERFIKFGNPDNQEDIRTYSEMISDTGRKLQDALKMTQDSGTEKGMKRAEEIREDLMLLASLIER